MALASHPVSGGYVFAMPYRVLFLLHSPAVTVFEIKRLDLPDTAPKNQLYQWLHYEAATATLTPLDFVQLHSAPPLEERQFRQGNLQFSAAAGTFWPTAGPAVGQPLVPATTLALPPQLAAQVTALLASR